MKPSYIIAFVVLIVTGGITMFSFKDSLAQHVTIDQVIARPGAQLQVPGAIVKDSVTYERGALRFDIVPVELLPKDSAAVLDTAAIPANAPRLTVVYSQPKPENFDNAKQVEAVGSYKDGEFHATSLLVKCPSKYSDKKKG